MTRKDYVLIAAALKRARAYVGQSAYGAAFIHGCDASAYDLANELAQDNPRFDRARFLKAAGVQS